MTSAETHPLRLGAIYPPFNLSARPEARFAELFVDSTHPDEQALFEGFFDADEAGIPVHEGMYGTPCVGAAVFADGAQTGEVEDLLGLAANADELFVVGSVVGGTGAGITHKLVQRLREKRGARPIFGIFLSKWFDVPPGGGSGAITPEVLHRNMTHGLQYFFDHTIPQLAASVVLGVPETKPATVLRGRVQVKPGDMSERAAYVNLVAAAALGFLPPALTANKDVKAYGIAHNDKEEGWLLSERKPFNAEVSLRRRVLVAMAVHELLAFLVGKRATIVDSAKDSGGHRSIGDLHTTLRRHGPEVGGLLKSWKPFEEFCGAFVDELERVRKELAFCLDWVRSIYAYDTPAGRALLHGHTAARGLDDLRALGDAGRWDRLRGYIQDVPLDAQQKRGAARLAREVGDQLSAACLGLITEE